MHKSTTTLISKKRSLYYALIEVATLTDDIDSVNLQIKFQSFCCVILIFEKITWLSLCWLLIMMGPIGLLMIM